MSIKIKRKKMIYSDIEKIVLETPNDMELGKKIRELYRREVDSLEPKRDADKGDDLWRTFTLNHDVRRP